MILSKMLDLFYYEDLQLGLIFPFFCACFRNTQPRFQFIVMNRRNTGTKLFL
jgi:hypothetical protein